MSKLRPKKILDDWNHQYQLEITVFYHDMQNKKARWTQVKNGQNLDLKIFFADWNLQYQQEIIVVYQNMQNKKSLSRKVKIMNLETKIPVYHYMQH